jgi:hypothetical protein
MFRIKTGWWIISRNAVSVRFGVLTVNFMEILWANLSLVHMERLICIHSEVNRHIFVTVCCKHLRISGSSMKRIWKIYLYPPIWDHWWASVLKTFILCWEICLTLLQHSHSTHTFELFWNTLFYLQGNFTVQEGREESTVSCIDEWREWFSLSGFEKNSSIWNGIPSFRYTM